MPDAAPAAQAPASAGVFFRPNFGPAGTGVISVGECARVRVGCAG